MNEAILKSGAYFLYVLVPWPNVQEFMDNDWFEKEAVLTEKSAYFIPLIRISDEQLKKLIC
jgi:hypothetical protein